MKLSVVSFFNSANLGDLLIASSLADFASEFGPVERISFSGDPFEHAGLDSLPAMGPTIGASRTMRARLAYTRPGHLAWKMKDSRRESHRRIRALMRACDAVLLGGGNMIFDLERHTRSSDRFTYFADMARSSQTPVMGIALGIGPFATLKQHRAACRALDKCSALTFRDESSLQLYLEFGKQPAELSVDPVLLMEQRIQRPISKRKHIAWNVVEPLLTGKVTVAHRQDALHRLAASVAELVSDGFVVDLFTTDRADERALLDLEALVASPMCAYRKTDGISDLLRLYQEADVVVACRMHALIVAGTQGVPIIGLAWQRKVWSLFDVLHRRAQCFTFQEFDPTELCGTVAKAAAAPSDYCLTREDRMGFKARQDVDRRIISRWQTSEVL